VAAAACASWWAVGVELRPGADTFLGVSSFEGHAPDTCQLQDAKELGEHLANGLLAVQARASEIVWPALRGGEPLRLLPREGLHYGRWGVRDMYPRPAKSNSKPEDRPLREVARS
jgi:hypothetical protein